MRENNSEPLACWADGIETLHAQKHELSARIIYKEVKYLTLNVVGRIYLPQKLSGKLSPVNGGLYIEFPEKIPKNFLPQMANMHSENKKRSSS